MKRGFSFLSELNKRQISDRQQIDFDKMFEECESIIKKVKYNISSSPTKPGDVMECALRQAFVQAKNELSELPFVDGLLPGSNLLQRAVDLAGVSPSRRIIVTLYPGNQGYTITVPGNTETPMLSYDDDILLEAIDNEVIPLAIMDLLSDSDYDLFWGGGLLTEVRDLRCGRESRNLVFLRPTTETLIADAKEIARVCGAPVLEVEARLLIETQEPLCLDPSPVVALITNQLQGERLRFSVHPMKRMAKRLSQKRLNWCRKIEAAPSNPTNSTFKLANFISKNQDRFAMARRRSMTSTAIQLLSPPPPPLSVPLTVEVQKFARSIERPTKYTENVDFVPRLIDEYILETERGNGINHVTKVTLKQRPGEVEVLGELYVERDHREGASSGKGQHCEFTLRSRREAVRYVQQFTEIFTEEGRKAVRITHRTPGQPSRVSCTPAMRVVRASNIQATTIVSQGEANKSQSSSLTSTSSKNSAAQPGSAQINAIVTNLMTSVQQFQSQQQSNNIVTTNAQPITLASLLTSTPTIQQSAKSVTVHLSTPTQQVNPTTTSPVLANPALSALLAGTPAADHPVPGATSSAALLERLSSTHTLTTVPTTTSGLSLSVHMGRLTGMPTTMVLTSGDGQMVSLPLATAQIVGRTNTVPQQIRAAPLQQTQQQSGPRLQAIAPGIPGTTRAILGQRRGSADGRRKRGSSTSP